MQHIYETLNFLISMKKIYALFIAFVAMLCSATTAYAYSITVIVDDATRVKVTVDGVSQSIKTGSNTITADAQYPTIEIGVTSSDYGLSKVVRTNKNNETSEEYIDQNSGVCRIYGDNSYNSGFIYTVTSFSYAEVRTAKCTVRVDNASMVTLYRGNTRIALNNGDNEIAFIPDTENSFTIQPATYGSYLYQVLLNDVAQSANSYGEYSLTVADKDVIQISANWPQKDVSVRFVAANAGTEAFIQSVSIDNVPVTNFANFTAPMGSIVRWETNLADFKVNSVKVNGVEISSQSVLVNAESGLTITYDVEKWAVCKIIVDIDHADRISLYKYVNYNQTEITGLQDGENTLEITENCLLIFGAKSSCRVESFTDDEGNDYTNYPSQGMYIPVKDGRKFTVITWAMGRNSQFVFYIDDPTKCVYGGSLMMGLNSGNRWSLDFKNTDDSGYLAAGYHTVAFDPQTDNPIRLSASGLSQSPVCYKQDELMSGLYGSYEITVADNDVVKLFVAGAPAKHNVTFEACNGCAFSEVVRDIIVPVADVTSPISVLTGTQISFKQTGAVAVVVNGATLAANEDGVYTVSITEDTKIVASDGSSTALAYTEAAVSKSVYTLQGMLLIQDATEAQINALPAGMYIINGKTTYLLQR